MLKPMVCVLIFLNKSVSMKRRLAGLLAIVLILHCAVKLKPRAMRGDTPILMTTGCFILAMQQMQAKISNTQ